ncbi:MAG: glycoside hydrolase family 3 C-terminal domain-containing protein, partial [Bacteroidota bacterium]
EEKVELLGGNGMKTMVNNRLDIPEIIMTDGPLGPNIKKHSTNYSAMINLAATFNTDLMYRVAEEIGAETRVSGRNMLLGPNINVARAPHGGRIFEGFGEDPYLISQMVVPYVKGVQSKRVITCTKHFVANNQEWNRFDVSAEIDERTLREIYFPAFKAAIQKADTWTIMAAYNRFREIYACENKYLLQDVLKDEWGFTGIAVSDWGGARTTIPMAKSGLDLEMPFGKYYGEKLLQAVKEGKVSEKLLDDKVSRILSVMFKAGLFDESIDTYGGHSDDEGRRRLAKKVADQSIVLLKNTCLPGQDNKFLPLNINKIKTIAVIGPNGGEASMTGGGSGKLIGNYSVSPYEAIINKIGDKVKVKFARGIPARSLDMPIAGPEFYLTKEGEPGIYAEYFNNKEVEGEPDLTRIEKSIDFNWGWGIDRNDGSPGSPDPDIIRPNKWSARWTGKFKSPGEGWYEIGLRSDNGVRMYLDEEKILDAWIDGKSGKFKVARYKFVKDKWYDLKIDFYENIGSCRCKLGFAPYDPGTMTKDAVKLATESDVVILAMGLDKEMEGEGVDRKMLNLDEDQLKLIQEILKVNKNVVMVLNGATPITMNEWIDEVPVLIDALYPGQEGANALADIIFGDVNPSGKLPLTFPKDENNTPVAETYPGTKELADYSEGIFVGYRWYDKENVEPLFPFGYGLSYTTFEYSDLKLSSTEMSKNDTLKVTLTIKNTGILDGDEIVQLYINDKEASVEREVKALKGFVRISLKQGESKTVSFKIDKSHLVFYDVNTKKWITEAGKYGVLVGSSSKDIRLTENVILLE